MKRFSFLPSSILWVDERRGERKKGKKYFRCLGKYFVCQVWPTIPCSPVFPSPPCVLSDRYWLQVLVSLVFTTTCRFFQYVFVTNVRFRTVCGDGSKQYRANPETLDLWAVLPTRFLEKFFFADKYRANRRAWNRNHHITDVGRKFRDNFSGMDPSCVGNIQYFRPFNWTVPSARNANFAQVGRESNEVAQIICGTTWKLG